MTCTARKLSNFATDIYDDGDNRIANCRTVETAEEFVKAVNSHDALVAALRDAGEVLDALTLGTIPQGNRYGATCGASIRVAAALALVDSPE